MLYAFEIISEDSKWLLLFLYSYFWHHHWISGFCFEKQQWFLNSFSCIQFPLSVNWIRFNRWLWIQVGLLDHFKTLWFSRIHQTEFRFHNYYFMPLWFDHIFCPYVPQEYILSIIIYIHAKPQFKYIFAFLKMLFALPRIPLLYFFVCLEIYWPYTVQVLITSKVELFRILLQTEWTALFFQHAPHTSN